MGSWSRAVRSGAGALAVLAAGGCGGEMDRGGASLPQRRDAAPGAGPGAPVWTVDPRPSLRLGVLSGDPAYQLQEVTAAAERSDGSLVVADGGAVRLYGPDGAYVRLLGGPGQGPGEFARPVQIVVDSHDGVGVWDDAHRRVTTFDAAGALVSVRTVRVEDLLQFLGPGQFPLSGRILADSSLVFLLTRKATGAGDKGGGVGVLPGPGEPESGLLHASGDLSRGRILFPLAGPGEVEVEAPWGAFRLTPPLAHRPVLATGPGGLGVCAGDQREPLVRCVARDGAAYEATWSAPPRPLAADAPALRRWRDSTREVLRAKLAEDQVAQLLDQVPVPEVRPPYGTIILDARGHLWVELGPSGGGGVDWRVFDARGRGLGPALLPDVRVVEIGDDHLLGVRVDELGVHFLERYDLLRPAASIPPSTGGDPPSTGTP